MLKFSSVTSPFAHCANGVSAGKLSKFIASGATERFAQSSLGYEAPVVRAKTMESMQGPAQSMYKYCLNEINLSLNILNN